MSMSLRLRRGLTAVAALGALALGGSALANAATSSGSSSSSSSTAQQGYPSPGGAPQGQSPRDPTVPGGHRAANGQTEAALPSDVAAKVKAAAEAKVSGGTVERVETDVDHGSPYEAHVRKSDGTELEVLVDKDFNVTAVNTMQHP
jgi:uncharacterized membrane protein YkoI